MTGKWEQYSPCRLSVANFRGQRRPAHVPLPADFPIARQLCRPWRFASFVPAAYIVTDIAALNYSFPQPICINNLGQVTFTNNIADLSLPSHAFLYSGGKTIDLGGLGGLPISSSIGGMNDAGQVVGGSTLPGGAFHAFLYGSGQMKDLGELGTARDDFSMARGINAAGQIVGLTTIGVGTPNMVEHAFLYANGVMKDLGVLPAKINGKAENLSLATGINAAGQVVGWSGWFQVGGQNHAFLYSRGGMKDLGVLGQFVMNGVTYSNSQANAINAAGQVVGGSTTTGSSFHAFLYSGGVMKDLGVLGVLNTPLGQKSTSNATAINSLGQIVGSSTSSYGYTVFLYRNGQMQDLNALLPPGSPWQIYEADGINDLGQIVARGTRRAWPRSSPPVDAAVLHRRGPRTRQPAPRPARPDRSSRLSLPARSAGLAKRYLPLKSLMAVAQTSERGLSCPRFVGCRAIVPLTVLCGCASIVSSPQQEVAISTDPPGATVQVDEQVIQSPGTVTLPRKKNYSIRVSHEGYYDNYTPLRSVESPLLFGNFLWDLPTTGLYMFITQGMNGLQIVGPGSIYDRATGAGYQLVPGKIELALERRPDDGSSARFAPNPRIVKELALPCHANEVYSEGGALWVVHGAEISRIDPETNERVETLHRPYCPVHFTESGAIWFVPRPFFGAANLCRMDRQTGKVSATVPLPKRTRIVRFGEGALWALAVPQGLGSAHKPLEVYKLDPESAAVVSRIPVEMPPATRPWISQPGLTVGLGSVWVSRGDVLARIDAASNEVTATIPLPFEPSNMVCGDDALWVFSGHDQSNGHAAPERMVRIDLADNQVGRAFPYPGRARGHAVGCGVVWILDVEGPTRTLQWIDPRTGEVTKSSLPLKAGRPIGPALARYQGDLWVVNGDSLVRIATD